MNSNTDYRACSDKFAYVGGCDNIKIHRESEKRSCACKCQTRASCTGRGGEAVAAPCRIGNNSTAFRMGYSYECTSTEVPESCVDNYPLAMAYVPMQAFDELYDPVSGLSHGTVFRKLDLPWYPTPCRKECRQ